MVAFSAFGVVQRVQGVDPVNGPGVLGRIGVLGRLVFLCLLRRFDGVGLLAPLRRAPVVDEVLPVSPDDAGQPSTTVTDLATFAELVTLDHGLCVVSTLRSDGSIQASVVNAGVVRNRQRDEQVVGLVTAGGSRKLRNLRLDPHTTIVARAGWQWVTVEGTATIIGPDDPHPGMDGDALRLLLRDIFRAAGGTHDDWDEYDRVMANERRAAVLISPRRIYSNPQ